MNKQLLIIVLFCVLFFYCEKDITIETVPPTDVYYHHDNIISDEVWSAKAPHVIDSEVYIQNAIVKIEPGATIKFKPGAALNVMQSAGLIADGSKAPILFTRESDQQDYWKYIYFGSNSIDDSCKLINCKFEWGGGDKNWPAIIYCQQASPTITNCEITNSGSAGVCLAGDCSSIIFRDNTITLNSSSPILTAAINVPLIGKGNYMDNGIDCIEIIEGTVNFDAVWPNFYIPYYIADDLKIQHAILTVVKGTTIKFEAQKGLSVTNNGSLNAVGQEIEPIIFSATQPIKGFWNCLYFDISSNGQLQNCIVEYGGYDSNYPANVYIDQASPVITNCTIRNSSRYGIYIKGEISPESFLNNTITANNKAPVSTSAISVPSLSGNSFSGNGEAFIEVRGGVIDKSSYWEDLELFYRVTDYLLIHSATLHIASGVTLEMSYDTHIDIMQGGGLIADGSSKLITFTGINKDPGSWNYIYFSNYSNDNNCILNHCLIEYGGGDGAKPANIYCEDASPTISNCNIDDSLRYGIYLAGDSHPVLENNHFHNNQSGSTYP